MAMYRDKHTAFARAIPSYTEHTAAHRDKYPSRAPTSHSTAKVEQGRYTGDKLRGIILLHKQAYSPVTNDEDPKDVSKIRRG